MRIRMMKSSPREAGDGSEHDFRTALRRGRKKCFQDAVDVVRLLRRHVRGRAGAQGIYEGGGLAVEVDRVADLGDLGRIDRLPNRPDLGEASLVPFGPAFGMTIFAAAVN